MVVDPCRVLHQVRVRGRIPLRLNPARLAVNKRHQRQRRHPNHRNAEMGSTSLFFATTRLLGLPSGLIAQVSVAIHHPYRPLRRPLRRPQQPRPARPARLLQPTATFATVSKILIFAITNRSQTRASCRAHWARLLGCRALCVAMLATRQQRRRLEPRRLQRHVTFQGNVLATKSRLFAPCSSRKAAKTRKP